MFKAIEEPAPEELATERISLAPSRICADAIRTVIELTVVIPLPEINVGETTSEVTNPTGEAFSKKVPELLSCRSLVTSKSRMGAAVPTETTSELVSAELSLST